MGLHETIAVWTDREATLAEELRAMSEEGTLEMANLNEGRTGVPGVIFISTTMGSHGPRVKYYLKTGRDQPSFSVAVASEPRVLANSLPDRDLTRMAPAVIDWVRLNHVALARFWWEGQDWILDEVRAFEDALVKL